MHDCDVTKNCFSPRNAKKSGCINASCSPWQDLPHSNIIYIKSNERLQHITRTLDFPSPSYMTIRINPASYAPYFPFSVFNLRFAVTLETILCLVIQLIVLWLKFWWNRKGGINIWKSQSYRKMQNYDGRVNWEVELVFKWADSGINALDRLKDIWTLSVLVSNSDKSSFLLWETRQRMIYSDIVARHFYWF